MLLHDLPQFRRPREKLLNKGVDALSDAELLALLIHTGYHHKNAVELSQKLLQKYTLGQFLSQPITTLSKEKGLGLAKIARLKACLAIATRISQLQPVSLVSTARDVMLLSTHLTTYKQEHLQALYLDARQQLLCQLTVSIGTINASLIHPREVFAPAIEHRATALIMVHNHPSGEAEPSADDIQATQRIADAGELLDIPLLDHVIVTQQSYFSFREHELV